MTPKKVSLDTETWGSPVKDRSVEVTVKEGSGVHSPFPVSFLPSLMPFMPYGQLHYSERPAQLSVSGNERES